MRYIIAIAILAIVFPSRLLASEGWMIQLGYTSGWGQSEGIYLDSNGKQGKPANWSFNDVEFCSSSLAKEGLATINSLVHKIPVEIPNDSKLTIFDNCDDERDHVFVIEQDSKIRVFSYPQGSKCLVGKEVPKWMSNLVEEVFQHTESIDGCE